jgi:hypothetical protein
MKACVTVDMEQDCPPFMDTYRGITEATARLLAVLAEERVPATFFVTGDIARRFPETVRALVDGGHEVGCHGDTHRPFDTLDLETARREIAASTAALREFYPVQSFRAPNLRFPDCYLPLLEDAGYRLDSSQARYKAAYIFGRPARTSLERVPASTTSSVLRLPKAVRFALFSQLRSPVVLFVHPWEFVDFRQSRLRLDCRFRTGEIALACLRENIRFFAHRQAAFVRMNEL